VLRESVQPGIRHDLQVFSFRAAAQSVSACIEPWWLQTFALVELQDMTVDSVPKFLGIFFFQEMREVVALEDMVPSLVSFFLDSIN